MTRPTQLRRIVAVLRARQPNAEYRHLLRLAALFIEAHREPEVVDFEAPAPRPAFFALPLDTAFGDGGWGVLNFERRQGMVLGDELPDDYFRTQARLRRLMGHS